MTSADYEDIKLKLKQFLMDSYDIRPSLAEKTVEEMFKKGAEFISLEEQDQPIRPKGEWEEYINRNDYNDYESEWYVCSKCHHIQLDATNFCSNCGAKMESEVMENANSNN